MSKAPPPRLTSGELEILAALWRTGPGTISDVHAALGEPIGYTTVQTRLNRLVNKGVVRKSDDRPAHYRAGFGPEEVSRRDLEVLVRRVNRGQVVPLVAYQAQIAETRQQFLAEEAKIYSAAYGQVRAAVAEYAQEHGIRRVTRSELIATANDNVAATDRKAVLQRVNRPILYLAGPSERPSDITDAILQRLNGAKAR